VLDIGCGQGYYFKINPDACGIDMDENCVEHLKCLGHRVTKGDIRYRLPFKDNHFKCVICKDVLEHFELEEVRHILLEVHRILGAGGLLVILIPNLKGFKHGLRMHVHKHFIVPEEISSITKGRYAIERHYPYPFPRFIGDYYTHNKEVIHLRATL
jgi:SAM-dependent methyltransferase